MERKHSTSSLVHYSLTYAFESRVQYYAHIFLIFNHMAVQTNSPQIEALRIAVEKRFGHRIESRYDYTQLGGEIEQITHEHIADNTLRRLWGGISGYDTVQTRTLNVLCRYAGFED